MPESQRKGSQMRCLQMTSGDRSAVAAALLLGWDARQARGTDMNDDGIPDTAQPTIAEAGDRD